MKLICFKLTSGEEVIAKVAIDDRDPNDKELLVDSPRVLVIQTMEDGRMGASFVPPLIMGSDQGVKVNLDNVTMWTYHIPLENEQRYLQSVSGIQLATNLKG